MIGKGCDVCGLSRHFRSPGFRRFFPASFSKDIAAYGVAGKGCCSTRNALKFSACIVPRQVAWNY
ncbi:hypothetical protein Agau_C100839 [Agrobacterium tumefaciens F2]|nr:hypothetical protein Agau_C100839 [Agrobacterium tumefaciens F2]